MGNYVSSTVKYYYGNNTTKTTSETVEDDHLEDAQYSDTDSELEPDIHVNGNICETEKKSDETNMDNEIEAFNYSQYFIRRSISYIHPRSNILYLMNYKNKNSSSKMKTLREMIVNHLDRNNDKYLITKDVHVEKVDDDIDIDTDTIKNPKFKVIKDDLNSVSQLDTHLESLQILRTYSGPSLHQTLTPSIYIDLHNTIRPKIPKDRTFSNTLFDIINKSPKYNGSIHNFVNVGYIYNTPNSIRSYTHYHMRNIYDTYNFIYLDGIENDTTTYTPPNQKYTLKWFFKNFIRTVYSYDDPSRPVQYASDLYKTYEYLKTIQEKNEIILFNVKNAKLCLLKY